MLENTECSHKWSYQRFDFGTLYNCSECEKSFLDNENVVTPRSIWTEIKAGS